MPRKEKTMYPILIVDDEKAIADLIEMTLQSLDYECVKAYSGEQAADLIETQRFDLILLDVMLPGVDGFSLIDYILPTGTPVIKLAGRFIKDQHIRLHNHNRRQIQKLFLAA